MLAFSLRREEVSLYCAQNPGFPELICVRGRLAALAGWWRGDFNFLEARRRGLVLEGSREIVRALSRDWFEHVIGLAGTSNPHAGDRPRSQCRISS